MSKKSIFVIILIALFTSSFLFYQTYKNRNYINNGQKKVVVKINQAVLQTEVANTKASREKGLSERNELKKDEGMLFVFDKKDELPIFWMKGMLIPLDIIWINDGKITKIDADVPPPESSLPDSKLSKYPSIGPTDYVLEVAAGYCQENGINIGDFVQIDF